MANRQSSAMCNAKYVILLAAVLALTSVRMRARADNGNHPFVGVWKLSFQKSHLREPQGTVAVYRQYEDRGNGWMFHTVINVTPGGSGFLFTAARYDGQQYPVYNAESLGNFLSSGAKTPRTVAFTRVNAYKFLWTDRLNGRVVEGGACTVSPDGSTLTITDQAPGQKATFVQVFDRQK